VREPVQPEQTSRVLLQAIRPPRLWDQPAPPARQALQPNAIPEHLPQSRPRPPGPDQGKPPKAERVALMRRVPQVREAPRLPRPRHSRRWKVVDWQPLSARNRPPPTGPLHGPRAWRGSPPKDGRRHGATRARWRQSTRSAGRDGMPGRTRRTRRPSARVAFGRPESCLPVVRVLRARSARRTSGRMVGVQSSQAR